MGGRNCIDLTIGPAISYWYTPTDRRAVTNARLYDERSADRGQAISHAFQACARLSD